MIYSALSILKQNSGQQTMWMWNGFATRTGFSGSVSTRCPCSTVHFLSDLDTYPEDLENYVLKPLFSFAGSGVQLHISADDLDAIPPYERHNFLLQRKVSYEPVIQSPDGLVKCEIRMLFIWHKDDDQPKLVTNLARLSRGEMIGVNFNKNKDWVGGSVCFFEP